MRAGHKRRSGLTGVALALGAVLLMALSACATLQEIAALRKVTFALDRVTDVRIAGIALAGRDSYSDLTGAEAARLVAAVTQHRVPLQMTVHVRAENPQENRVTARLVELDWTLFIEDRRTVDGKLPGTILLPPGQRVDVPLGVQLDMVEFFRGGARDLFQLALAIAGQGTQEIRIEAVPTIETSLGPIRYPTPIVIRHEVGTGS